MVIMVGVRDRSEMTSFEISNFPSVPLLPFLLPLFLFGEQCSRKNRRVSSSARDTNFRWAWASVGTTTAEEIGTGEFPLDRGTQRRAAAIDIHGACVVPDYATTA